jgi:hypothetical protein
MVTHVAKPTRCLPSPAGMVDKVVTIKTALNADNKILLEVDVDKVVT